MFNKPNPNSEQAIKISIWAQKQTEQRLNLVKSIKKSKSKEEKNELENRLEQFDKSILIQAGKEITPIMLKQYNYCEQYTTK